ncbi:MAG: cation diffusion facilitator family transporter [Longicatena sp.]|nr:cation diffusion facilitator family transporter [Longicatena sp.]
MIGLLAKKYIKDYQNYEAEAVRNAYGSLTSIVGIVNNIVLFGLKFLAGTIAGSVSITADAINNLSDAGSSIISLVSFKLSSMPADEEHPFGHARYECIASMVVACLIMMLGWNLLMDSVDKILHPGEISFSWLSIVILVFSIAIKGWMYLYNHKYGKLVSSSIMEATAADSLSDAMSTSAVLISAIISPLIHFNLDGYMGVVVAVLILIAGTGIVRGALDELLGKAPKIELVEQIQEKIMAYDGVIGMHDLMVHDYGAHKTFASVHVEVDSSVDVMLSHDMIDNIERDFLKDMGIHLVIHMDPVNLNDPLTNELKVICVNFLKQIDENLSLHDFRIVSGNTHTNIIFDILVPFCSNKTNAEILKELNEKMAQLDGVYYLVITFDRAYVPYEMKGKPIKPL